MDQLTFNRCPQAPVALTNSNVLYKCQVPSGAASSFPGGNFDNYSSIFEGIYISNAVCAIVKE